MNIKEIKEKIRNNKSLTVGEIKFIRDLLGVDCEITTFNNVDYSHNRPRLILLQKDVDGDLLPLGHFVSMFINPNNNTLYYYDCSDGSEPLRLHQRYGLSTKAQPIKDFYNYIKKFNIDYFDEAIQSKTGENCAWSALLRIINKDLDNEQYKHFLKELKDRFNFKTYDDLINHIMLLYLDKF